MGIVLLHRERGSAALKDTQKVWLCAVPSDHRKYGIPETGVYAFPDHNQLNLKSLYLKGNCLYYIEAVTFTQLQI